MTHPDDTTPDFFSDGVFFPSVMRRSPEEWKELFVAERIVTMRRQRKPRQPTLENVRKQARKAGIDVARFELKPDGTIVIVTGKPEPAAPENPWLADLKVAKR